MDLFPTFFDLAARFDKLSNQSNELYNKLDVYHIALNEITYLSNDKRTETLQVLILDLHKLSGALMNLQQIKSELMSVHLPPSFAKRMEPLSNKLEELYEFYQTVAMKTKVLQDN